MIHSLNLSLSNRCIGDCVFCPETRGKKHHIDMPFEIAKKAIDEVSSSECPWVIRSMEMGENGEALLNNDFLKIVRYAREKLPNATIDMANNFSMMREDIARTILREKLFDSMGVNIDGHDKESYELSKFNNYNAVIRNLKRFIELRNKLYPTFSFSINVMPLFEYVSAVNRAFGTMPTRLKTDIPFSDYDTVVEMLREFVPEDIPIVHSSAGLWAERSLVDPNMDMSEYNCPIFHRVLHEIFLAPNGEWYPCCCDDNQDQPLGNIKDKTLVEIFHSKRRKEFIQDLMDRNYEKIGHPCNTAVCCNVMDIDVKDIKTKFNFKKGDKIIWSQEDKTNIFPSNVGQLYQYHPILPRNRGDISHDIAYWRLDFIIKFH